MGPCVLKAGQENLGTSCVRRGENLCMSNGRFMARQALRKSVVVFCNPKHSCFVNWKDLLIKVNGGCFSSNPIQQLHPYLKAEATMLLFPTVYIFGNNCSVLYMYQDLSRLKLDFSAQV